MDLKRTSKFISLILRHRPDTIGIRLDEHGWARVDELVAGVARTHPLTLEMLEEIVRTDEKQRYAFSGDHTRIRANQGHSVHVDVKLEETVPPTALYHGTSEKYVAAIEREGLLPRSRLHVHLSPDEQTARKVGSRHGRPVVFLLDTQAMVRDGFRFFRSANGVWLVCAVPARYLSRL